MKRCLLILPNNPGDVLMGLHAAAALKKQNPADRIAFAVDAECAALVQNNPCVDVCLEIPRKAIRENRQLDQAARILEDFLQQCADFAPDQIVNLFQGEYGAVLSGLIPAATRLGPVYRAELGRITISDPWSRYLHAIPAQRSANQLHVVDIFQRICGIVEPQAPALPLPAVPAEEAQKIHMLLPTSAFIAFQPGSAWPGKQWPRQHWIALGGLLCEQTDFSIVLLGAPQESSHCADIAAQLPAHRVVNLCGRTTLLGVRTVLEKAQTLICGDTFAMHLASALHTPVLALFGPSNPQETGPYQIGAQILCALPPQNLGETLAFRDTTILPQLLPQEVLRTLQGQAARHPLLQAWWDGHRMRYHGLSAPRLLSDPLQADLHQLNPAVRKLLHQQRECLNHTVNGTATLIQLEKKEQQLAEQSRDSLSMEMYRMALNALPPISTPDHLPQRLLLMEKLISLLN